MGERLLGGNGTGSRGEGKEGYSASNAMFPNVYWITGGRGWGGGNFVGPANVWNHAFQTSLRPNNAWSGPFLEVLPPDPPIIPSRPPSTHFVFCIFLFMFFWLGVWVGWSGPFLVSSESKKFRLPDVKYYRYPKKFRRGRSKQCWGQYRCA